MQGRRIPKARHPRTAPQAQSPESRVPVFAPKPLVPSPESQGFSSGEAAQTCYLLRLVSTNRFATKMPERAPSRNFKKVSPWGAENPRPLPGIGPLPLIRARTNFFEILTGCTFLHFSRKTIRANQTNQITGFRAPPNEKPWDSGLGTRGLWALDRGMLIVLP